MSWGAVKIGRLTLRETFDVEESVNAQSGLRTIKIAGQESTPPLTRDELYYRRDAMLGINGDLVQVQFEDKPELDGYYDVQDSNASISDYNNEVITLDWTFSLNRLGVSGETDLESRLSGIRRLNAFALSGESWHAPSIGHYSYYTGSTSPSIMTRTTEDGTITVYRTVPSAVAPRWGALPENYPKGRVRILSDGREMCGRDVTPNPSAWYLSNGIVRVGNASGGGTLQVSAWNGSAYENKNWNVTIAGSGAITGWNSVTIMRNNFEYATVRLIKSQGPSEVGRIVLDLSLRRGSRFVEGYLQSSSSTTLSVHLNASETMTNVAASGYVVATNNDADGNKITAGSSQSFTAHANGGVTKSAATAMDFYLGVVFNGSSAVSGDQVLDVRNQYIGVLPEIVSAVWR